MEFVTTERGARKLLYEGYAYTVSNKHGATIYWRCEKRFECGVSLKTINDVIQGYSPKHSHPPSESRNAALKVVHEIKQRACETEEVTGCIVDNATSTLPLSVAGALPKKSSLLRAVNRKRTIQESEDLNITTRGENFKLYEDEKVTIYGTVKNLDLLAQKSDWFCDGTFDCAPIGTQLYTIHMLISENKTLPLLYCLSGRKDEETYDIICKFIKQSRCLNVSSIMIDFEQAVIKVIKKNFPEVVISGCFFHFAQCLWRNLQSRSLQIWYREGDNAFLIKQIEALAFAPPQDVCSLFDDFVQSLDTETDEILSNFLVYFETTWLGVIQRGRRRRPIFDIDMWSVNSRVKNNLPRTNNSVEGWHHAFNKRVSVRHPTLSKLIRKLRKEQASNELSIEQVNMGMDISRKNKKYDRVNERLKATVNGYNRENGLQFLKAIAFNL